MVVGSGKKRGKTDEELAEATGTFREDLRGLGMTWEAALDAAEDRDGWRI